MSDFSEHIFERDIFTYLGCWSLDKIFDPQFWKLIFLTFELEFELNFLFKVLFEFLFEFFFSFFFLKSFLPRILTLNRKYIPAGVYTSLHETCFYSIQIISEMR